MQYSSGLQYFHSEQFPSAAASSSPPAFRPLQFSYHSNSLPAQQLTPHASSSAYPYSSLTPRTLRPPAATPVFQTDSAPQPPPAFNSVDPDATPVVPWNDSPRTMYKTSPETELGDVDLDDGFDTDGEDDGVMHVKKSRVNQMLPCTDPLVVLPSRPLQGDVSLEDFTKQLHHHIRLFQPNLPNILTQTAPQSVPILVVQPSQPQIIPPSSPQQPVASPAIQTYARPTLPVMPVQPVRLAPRPQYQLPVIDPRALRNYRPPSPPQPTVGPRDLILPDAEFHFGYDPEEILARISGRHQASSSIAVRRDVEYPAFADNVPELVFEIDDDNATADGELEEDFAPQELSSIQQLEASSPKRQVHFDAPQVFVGVKRARSPSVHSSVAVDEESDMSDEEDDGEEPYRPSSHSSRPTKRHRPSASTSAIPATRHRPTRSIDAEHNTPSNTSKRSRHLLRDIPRTHTCDYGCTATFSTAYESRRHQEDVHVRNEATEILDSLSGPDDIPTLRPQDNKFLFKIALGGLAKWDERTKEAVRQYRDTVEATGQSDTVSAGVMQTVSIAVKKFAQGWVERYICQGCGTKFSRMDSKKRHQKECKKAGATHSRGRK